MAEELFDDVWRVGLPVDGAGAIVAAATLAAIAVGQGPEA